MSGFGRSVDVIAANEKELAGAADTVYTALKDTPDAADVRSDLISA